MTGGPNRSFSEQMPGLQLIVDQTSIGLFKECPRKYYYRMIEGIVPRAQNVHLKFGTLMHEGCEKYELAKAAGDDHEEAVRKAVKYVMVQTWDKITGKPWDSGHKEKNRYTLLRTLVWYLDSYGENDKMETIMLKNGRPAIELTFQFNPNDFETGERLLAITGEPIFFAGHIDRMVNLEGAQFVSDRKTTGSSLGASYFAQYTPNNQFSMYSLAGRWYFDVDIQGVICDVAQVKVTFSRFERQTIYRTLPQLREWYADTRYWLALMGASAEKGRYPQNDTACHHYGGCPYRPICARTPSARETWMKLDYAQTQWDPSVARGE